MTNTDFLGDWIQIGSCTPEFDEWVYVGSEHKVTSGNYRLKFTSNNFKAIKSFAWIRAIYNPNNDLIVSPARRVYPKPEPMHLEFPLPINLVNANLSNQQFQIKKILKWRYSTDWLWRISLEQLVLDTQNDTRNTFMLDLDNPTYSKDPERSELWVTTFNQPVPYSSYEVGRYYDQRNQVISDPITDAQPYKLIAIFTADQPIPPDLYKVRIVY